jgi:hypothetical protein
MMSESSESNKTLVQSSFDRWRAGTGSPFELLVPGADWTIVGSSPLSKTYPNRQAFLDAVIVPFNARLAKTVDTVGAGHLRRWRHGNYLLRRRRYSERWSALSQYLHLVLSDERGQGGQCRRLLRHERIRRILEPRGTDVLRDRCAKPVCYGTPGRSVSSRIAASISNANPTTASRIH